MKQDKFLTGILIGIGVLILLALGLFFMRQDRRDYAAGDSPDSVVHNYVLAILNEDYQKAYGYLADRDYKPTYEQFRQSFFNGNIRPDEVGVDIGSVDINGDEAVVNLSIYYPNSDPFSTNFAGEERALLTKQNGAWKLNTMPYNFWDYSWYSEPIAP